MGVSCVTLLVDGSLVPWRFFGAAAYDGLVVFAPERADYVGTWDVSLSKFSMIDISTQVVARLWLGLICAGLCFVLSALLPGGS